MEDLAGQSPADKYANLLRQRFPPSVARDRTIEAIASAVATQIRAGTSLEAALSANGVRNAPDLARLIRTRAGSKPVQRTYFYAGVVHKVVGDHGYIDIPDTACIDSHLPTDREPTDDEIEDAIQACREVTSARRVAAVAAELPMPERLHALLPPDQRPSLDALRRAWEACAGHG